MHLLEATEEAKQMRENIRDLLASEIPENITLALQLIQGGGMHTSFIYPLWANYYNIDKFFQKQVHNLLKDYLPHNANYKTLSVPRLLQIVQDLMEREPIECNVGEFVRWIFPQISHKIAYFDHFYTTYPAYRHALVQAKIAFEKTFDLQKSTLPCLPTEIGDFPNLTVVNIQESTIAELPESFFKLQKLRKFHYEKTPLARNKPLLKRTENELPLLTAITLCDKATRLYYSENYKAAAKQMEQAIALVQDDFECWRWYAETHRLAEKKKVALQGFEKAQELNPKSGAVYAKIAELKCGEHKREEALEMCEYFIQNMSYYEYDDSAESDVYFVKGLALFWLKRYDESILAYKRANALNDYAGTWYNLACSYSKRGNKTEMLTHLEEAFVRDWDEYYFFCLEDKDRDFEDFWEDRDYQNLCEQYRNFKGKLY